MDTRTPVISGFCDNRLCVWTPEEGVDSPDLSQAEQRVLPGAGVAQNHYRRQSQSFLSLEGWISLVPP